MRCPGEITHARGLLALMMGLCLVAGCGPIGPGKTDLSTDEKHILKLASLYTDFKGAHQGAVPKDAAELKQWAKGMKKEDLAKRGIDNLDEAFVSPRDHQPYVLVKPELGKMGPGGRPPMLLAYEQTGVSGKRMCANGMGYAWEADEEQLKQLQSGGPPSGAPPGH
jgi:hypothetical protein